MSDAALRRLAEQAGIALAWRDVFGQTHEVTPETLRSVLTALDIACASAAQIDDSLAALDAPRSAPPLITATVGEAVYIPASAARYELVLEDGRRFDGHAEQAGRYCVIPAILETGWHSLTLGATQSIVAVAPRACPPLSASIPDGRGYALAAQLYSLRGTQDGGFGDFAALESLVRAAARHGAHGVAISPVHAQFSADPDRFAPYAPSSRIALNVLHAAVPTDAPPAPDGLIDWPKAARAKLTGLRAAFARARLDADTMRDFAEFRRKRGPALELHARFEAIQEHFIGQDPGLWHWRSWPEAYRNPAGAGVAAFAHAHADAVEFHAFAQYLAFSSMAAAQRAARDSGMGIGLIADLAVGVDSGGSQCWASPVEMLTGLTIGAPPDLLQPRGQNWGLTALSPSGLAARGFRSFTDMLDAALENAGGVRIDHALGLHRLWVIPYGAEGHHGAYLHCPELDLMRLIALHAERARAVVIGEDLGTLPEGFQHRMEQSGMLGMRVLWFERRLDGSFIPPAHWTRPAAAMTSTHDLPTIAGWWQGRDLAWRDRFDQLRDPSAEYATRAADRGALWAAMCESGAAEGDAPPLDAPSRAVDAAVRHAAGSACDLFILPMEDAVGQTEQPNIPGTTNEHPNWRRRLPAGADALLDAPETAARLATAARRGRPA